MIVHVASSVTTTSSGLAYAAKRLCEAVIEAGEEVTLVTLDAGAPRLPPFARAFPRGLGPRRLGRAPALRRWLAREARDGGVEAVHVHGLWRLSLTDPARISAAAGVPLVVAPHGSLSRWAMRSGSRLKPLFWATIQRPAFRHTACWHATSEAECDDIRRLGFRQPVALVPNGIELPPEREASPRSGRTLLFLARIHRKKGVDVLLDAWRQVQDGFPDWRLVIAGRALPDEEPRYLDAMRRRAAARGAARVSFPGELLGSARENAYAAADLYVLPTWSENFGLTIAEALAAGTPVITTTEAPWGGLAERRAGWWIAPGVASLAACLREALATEGAVLRAMGRRGRRWMESEFAWRDRGRRMARTYDWLRGQAERPDWVRLA